MRYRRYDNYDAIEVVRVADIPADYNGVMGVPITFLNKYCPEQFEIVGITEANAAGHSNGVWTDKSSRHALIEGKRRYARIFIRRRSIEQVAA